MHVCPGVQDTRQQLQATQQQLEAELQDFAAQVSTAEMKLAAEPAKQRALALQVLATTCATTLARADTAIFVLSWCVNSNLKLNAATSWHQTTHACPMHARTFTEEHTVSLL